MFSPFKHKKPAHSHRLKRKFSFSTCFISSHERNNKKTIALEAIVFFIIEIPLLFGERALSDHEPLLLLLLALHF